MNSLHSSSNTALIRPRSTRSSALSNKPHQATRLSVPTTSSSLSSASPTSTTGSGSGSGGGLTTAAATTATSSVPIASTTSSLSLFLTNLRLLDLDLHPDWPEITALTFTAKDAAHGQKRRIQAVEWALYQLFTLWDPDEARNKLKPFFPPLDQVQSLNLRAALLRCLEHAKKNGVLGRDAVVRKTMLDECKGERLEEVLAAFSSAVLKKLVAQLQLDEPTYPAVAQTLALENRGYSTDRAELGILVLAHKASLARLVRDKNSVRTQFSALSEALSTKEQELERRRTRIATGLESPGKTTNKNAVTNDAKLDMWRLVRNNWSGNERWMETLLYGDSRAKKDGILSSPFDRVWRRVQSGRLAELQDTAGGLLEQLDRRANAQKERLERWQKFRYDKFGNTAAGSAPKLRGAAGTQRGIDLGFGIHETLQLNSHASRKPSPAKAPVLTQEYSDLIGSLRDELSSIDKGNNTPPSLPRSSRVRKARGEPPEIMGQDAVSEISDLEDEPPPISAPEYQNPIRPASLRSGVFNQSEIAPDNIKPETSRVSVSTHQPSRSSAAPIRPSGATRQPAEEKPRRSTPPESPSRRQPPPQRDRTARPAQPSPEKSPEKPPSPTRLIAEQILASVDATSPSPVKKQRHTLSLSERTRLSMVRRGSQSAQLDDDESEFDLFQSRSPPKVKVDAPEPSKAGVGTPAHDDGEHPFEDLAARTRRSMVGYEAARQKAQLERRRSQRKSKQLAAPAGRREGSSYFSPLEEEGNSTLLAEELMNNPNDDYEAVFRSRPRVKTSPVGTPVKGFEE